MWLAFVLFVICIIGAVSSYQLNISSDSLVSINDYDTTSTYLLGLSAYAGVGPLTNDSFLKQLNTELGVNVVGFGEQLNGILPTNQQQAEQCCNTVSGLTKWINDGSACNTYKNTYDPKVWNTNFWKSDTSITTFLYLIDSCNAGYYPELNHCLGTDTGKIAYIYLLFYIHNI